MKICFINPSVDKYSDLKLWSTDLMKSVMGEHITTLPKLSILVLAAVVPKEWEVQYLDEEVEDVIYDEIDADVVAITAMSVQAPRAFEIADNMKKRNKTVVMGGIHASIKKEESLEHCDSIMVGEGENTLPVLLQDVINNNLNRIYDASEYPPVEKFVSPRLDILKPQYYLQFPIQATRGCPYDCEFCSIKYSSGRKYRMKPIEQVISEIKEYEKLNKGVFKKGYFFVDDNLYVNKEYTKKLFKAMKDMHITWSGQGTMNITEDEEALQLLEESGCRNFSIGFESISEESLKEANKPKCNKTNQYKEALERLANHGIVPAGTFIFGFDSDDVTSFKKTVDFAMSNHIYTPFFSILTPLPGTRLYEKMDQQNRIFDKDWKKYNALKCVFKPAKMTAEELQEGAYWASIQISKMDVFKEHLDYFWSHGPWKYNPRLKLFERLLLIGMAFKFRKKPEYKKFLLWAAKQKNAADFNNIVTALLLNDMASQLPDCHDPALKYSGVNS